MKLSALEGLCSGHLEGGDIDFSSLSIDSRKVMPGDLYLAISGERFDGNDYAGQAVEQGARGVVISKAIDLEVPTLTVADTQTALAEVAGYCRRNFEGPVIAITGSSGKTTTRKMLAAIMSTQGKVCATQGNQNNEIGVPLTLLGLSRDHSSAVIEMGARKLGDILYLGNYVRPTVAVLLNAGEAHIGEFGGYSNIVKGKGEIYQSLTEGGVAIINMDDPAAQSWLAGLSGKRVVAYGLSPNDGLDVTALKVNQSSSSIKFELSILGEVHPAKLCVPGIHNVSNALAAAAAAHAAGVALADICAGLTHFEPEGARQTMITLAPNLSVLDDSYNANPSSMKAALNVLALQGGRRIAVLGEMGELGDSANSMHLELADYAASTEIDNFWLIGKYAESMATRIGNRAEVFETKSDIANSIPKASDVPICVLLKASRSIALEDVLEIYKRGTH
jgi:UDP-N-acetylmuramoyl-tripeptide--D-alanyl-D-alanine ligase